MAKKNILSLLQEIRDFTLTLEPVSGGLTLFYAFINDIKVIDAEATEKRSWKGKVPKAKVNLKIRVIGIGDATFKLGIDLPDTADDQSLTLKLNGGYYETEISL